MVKHLAYGVSLDVLRRAADLTHEELAEGADVPFKTVQRVCRGKGRPDVLTLFKILRFLRVKNVLKVFPPEDFEREAGS